MRPGNDLDAIALSCVGRMTLRAALLLMLTAMPGSAQMIRGVVRDSVSRIAIPGVVVSISDSVGNRLARTLTDGQGAYRMGVAPGSYRLRLVRIGFRMRELPVRIAEGQNTLDLSISALPSLLEPIKVVGAAKCRKRSDNAAAQALLEQARAGLLNSVVARDANPATITRYAFERWYSDRPDTAAPSIRIDSTRETTTSFVAVMTGAEFTEFGFQHRNGDRWDYYGPDAEVLLDDGFAAGYCFRIADRDRSRPNQVGLGFEAAERKKGRVDIVGTLWIDTVARALRDIQFKYAGLPGLQSFLDAGGETSFREMANGVVIVDQWALRLQKTRLDTVWNRQHDKSAVLLGVGFSESGGFLAKAAWADGTVWSPPMGVAKLRLMVNDSTPAVAADVRLQNTDFRGFTDTAGNVELRDLFPGRYRVIVVDTLLASIGVELNPQFSFTVAPNGTVERKERILSTAEELLGRCRASHPDKPADLALVITVLGESGGVPGVLVDVTVTDPTNRSEQRTLSEKTGGRGTILLCLGRGDLGSTISAVGAKGSARTEKVSHAITNRVTVIQLRIDSSSAKHH